jgi:hypothetical protein
VAAFYESLLAFTDVCVLRGMMRREVDSGAIMNLKEGDTLEIKRQNFTAASILYGYHRIIGTEAAQE